ncbi:MAG: cytochrome, partial [Rhodococcus erythropolis]|nr:cytochrome [Rhodococcus erythropolis]
MATRPTFDLIDGRFYSGDLGNVRDAYAWMRDHEPVYRDDANGITAAA